jgi:regulatory protein
MVEVWLDTGTTLRLHERRILDLALQADCDLDTAAHAELERCAAADAAEQRLVRLLARRPRSRAELRGRLLGWGVDPASTEAVLERLTGLGLIDDRLLARSVAERRRARGHGRLRVAQDLARLRVDPAVAADALAEGSGGQAELGRARAELRRRFGGAPQAAVDRRRAAGHLMRRGFEQDVVIAALGVEDDG